MEFMIVVLAAIALWLTALPTIRAERAEKQARVEAQLWAEAEDYAAEAELAGEHQSGMHYNDHYNDCPLCEESN